MKAFKVKAVKPKEFTNTNGSVVTSVLVYLTAVSASGFGKSEIIYTNFDGDTLPEVNSIHELDETRIQPVEGSDKKIRKWFI